MTAPQPGDETTRYNILTLAREAGKLADAVKQQDGYSKDEPMVKVNGEGVECVPIPYGEWWQLVNQAAALKSLVADMQRIYRISPSSGEVSP